MEINQLRNENKRS